MTKVSDEIENTLVDDETEPVSSELEENLSEDAKAFLEGETDELPEDAEEITETEAEELENETSDDDVEEDAEETSEEIEKDSDDEFMDSISEEPQKYTPAQAKQKLAFWQNSIETAEKRIDELEPIHQVHVNDGLDPIMDEVKKSLNSAVNEEKTKEIKDHAKTIEAIHIVSKLIRDLNSDYVQCKRDIERYKAEIEKLGVVQLDIFEEAEKQKAESGNNDTTTPDDNVVEKTPNETEPVIEEGEAA